MTATATAPAPAPAATMSPARAWVAALRLRTLSAGAAPVLVGLALAWDAGVFRPEVAAMTLLAALLIQVAVNLANDYYDHRKGVDKADRVGPARVTGKALPESRVKAAMALALLAAAAVGLYLVLLGGWPILLIGAASLVCALAYAGGPWPLGHHGLGEVFVFAFFGPVAVAGTFYLQAGAFPAAAWLAGAGVGALASAILVVNNVRDIPTDARAGKRTMAVRLGVRGSWSEYAALLGLAYAVPVGLAIAYGQGLPALLPLATLPLALLVLRQGLRSSGPALNGVLARTSGVLGLYGLLLALGVAL